MQLEPSIDTRRRAYGYAICASIFLSYLLVYFHRVNPSVLALFVAFTGSLPLWALFPLFFLLFVGGNATGPTSAIVAKELCDTRIAGTSVGLVNCFPFFIGGIYQVLMGRILERSGLSGGVYVQLGYQRVFLVALVSATLSLAAALFVQETLSTRADRRSALA